MTRLVALALVLVASPALAGDAELDRATVVYARGGALYKSDGRGKNEARLVQLPAGSVVRALRSDPGATVLLADLGGKWSWLPLDGSRDALTALPCADGPAQLAVDGTAVVCKHPKGTGSLIVQLPSGKQTPVDVPIAGARLCGTGVTKVLVWADKAGVWSAPPATPTKKTKLAPESPLRSFLPSPDGTRAVGVFRDRMYEGRKKQIEAEMLMGFALDGSGARRKGIRNGVPLEWSHDNTYVLVQEGSKACLMRATGGQYKCWKGFTAVSLAPDGSYALVVGNRDASKSSQSKSKSKSKSKKKASSVEPGDEPQNEQEDPASNDPAADDVPVAPPAGARALYRAKLDGPYDTPPELVTKIVDGAAVWVPGR